MHITWRYLRLGCGQTKTFRVRMSPDGPDCKGESHLRALADDERNGGREGQDARNGSERTHSSVVRLYMKVVYVDRLIGLPQSGSGVELKFSSSLGPLTSFM